MGAVSVHIYIYIHISAAVPLGTEVRLLGACWIFFITYYFLIGPNPAQSRRNRMARMEHVDPNSDHKSAPKLESKTRAQSVQNGIHMGIQVGAETQTLKKGASEAPSRQVLKKSEKSWALEQP